MKILVTGATGFVGAHLISSFSVSSSVQFIILARNVDRARKKLGAQHEYLQWADPLRMPQLDAVSKFDGVINLMGANLAAKRWSDRYKKELFNSRVDATEQIFKAIEKFSIRPKFFINMSAIGFYGNTGAEIVTENSPAGKGFMARLCQSWEKAAWDHQKLTDRLILLRAGVVLGRDGGMIKTILPPFQMGLGGKLGSGNQYLSWIHVDDLIGIIKKIISDETLNGTINAVSEYPCSNEVFTRKFAEILRKPSFCNVPAFVLKLAMGEMSNIVLEGQRVIPTRLKEIRFHYKYPTLEMALKASISKERI